MELILRLWLWLLVHLGLAAKPELLARLVDDTPVPETVKPGELLVVGGKNYQKWGYFRCPCGCGELIMLSLSTQRRPRWSITWDRLKRPSIEPSVRQTAGCYSHFWVRRGVIDWCRDTGRKPR